MKKYSCWIFCGIWLFPGNMTGGYNLRNKQVDDAGEENTDKSENFEMSIEEQTDIGTAAFISSLKQGALDKGWRNAPYVWC